MLILGGAGMLGHKLYQRYRQRYDVFATLRGGCNAYARYQIFDADRVVEHVDAFYFDSMVQAIAQTKPDDSVSIDRSLDSTRFRQTTGFQPPSCADMIGMMASDPTPYDSWR